MMDSNSSTSGRRAQVAQRDLVLVVDDDPVALQALSELLNRSGYVVEAARGGAAALQQIAQARDFSLLIVAYQLDEVSGPAVLKAAAAKRLHVPCLALASSADPNVLAESIRDELVARVLLKPWDDTALISVVNELISSYRARRERERLLALATEQQAEIERLRSQLAQYQSGGSSQITSDDTVQDLIALMAFLLDSRSKGSGQSKRVAQLSSSLAVARGFSEEEVRQLEAAALLKDIAQIAAPASPPGEGQGRQGQLAEELQPLIAGEILKRISGFEEIAEMVRQLQTGAASTGSGEIKDLPLGSQILAIAETFDREMYPTGSPTGARPSTAVKAIEKMAGDERTADLVQLFRHKVLPIYAQAGKGELEIAAYDLEPGLVLARDVVNIQGVPLLAAGTVLDLENIRHMRDNDGFSPLLSRIFIKTASISLAPGEEELQAALSAPAGPPPEIAAPPAAQPAVAAQVRPTVVVVDDERSVVAALKRELSSAGYTVIGFTDPEEGLEYIRQGGEALAVISDYMMPGMLGSTLLMRIQEERPNLPCIVITAHATQDTISRLAHSAQMVRLLRKPWDKDQLLKTLESFRQQAG